MADGVSVNEAGAATRLVATDSIGGSEYQRIKAGWGTDGTWNETEDTAAKQFPVGGSAIGSLTETAPASDTASSGLNGRLQRIAQRITSLIALVPASLGSKAAASSFAVTDSTEDIARMGIITETAPASDTASSGINGRLQRIAQQLTSLIALVPTALTSLGNFKVALAEWTGVAVTPTHSVVTATTTSGALLASNASRKSAILTNIGIVDVFIKLNATAVASQGILLQAYGGTYVVAPLYNNFTTTAINGITASSTAVVLITEFS